MNTQLALLICLVLALYPLAAPWKKPFAVGWFVIWFGLWTLLFVLSDHEATHLTKGILSGSAVGGVLLSVFAIASLSRLLFQCILLWRARCSPREEAQPPRPAR